MLRSCHAQQARQALVWHMQLLQRHLVLSVATGRRAKLLLPVTSPLWPMRGLPASGAVGQALQSAWQAVHSAACLQNFELSQLSQHMTSPDHDQPYKAAHGSAHQVNRELSQQPRQVGQHTRSPHLQPAMTACTHASTHLVDLEVHQRPLEVGDHDVKVPVICP